MVCSQLVTMTRSSKEDYLSTQLDAKEKKIETKQKRFDEKRQGSGHVGGHYNQLFRGEEEEDSLDRQQTMLSDQDGFFDSLAQIVGKSSYWSKVPVILQEHRREAIEQVLTSRDNSTVKKYLAELKKFFNWSRKNGITVDLPYDSIVAAMYLSEFSKQTESSASVILAYSALKWLLTYTLFPENNPLETDLCRNIVESSKRSKSKPVTKKTPITADIIKQIINEYATPGSNLKDLRISTICTVGFAGFLRFNEISNILPTHLTFMGGYMSIFIPSSKTDIYREGNIVYIDRLHNKYGPVNLVIRYIETAGIEFKSTLPLFRSVSYHRSSNSSSIRKSGLSYTRCREIFKSCHVELGYDARCFGLHSLRSGGITSVVQHSKNSISDRLLKLHGRWKTDTAKDMYVHEDVQNRLAVTNFLGLWFPTSILSLIVGSIHLIDVSFLNMLHHLVG
ncbi:uncharacterized protein [Montipora capricornis]|uniref:uncharacterized protein isoform X4 n=1 Tax=Montipora capricornis TaxID=246305 RepID=UPI0035F1B34F